MDLFFYLTKCGSLSFNYSGRYGYRYFPDWQDLIKLPFRKLEYKVIVVLVDDYQEYTQFFESLSHKVENFSLLLLLGENLKKWSSEDFKQQIFSIQHLPLEPRELDILIFNAGKLISLLKKESFQQEEEKLAYNFENIIGISLPMQEVFQLIEKVSRLDVTVLLTGESGTGKELVAKSIHYNSQRQGNFVAINCAALPEDLLESELFGHVKGAFTGAIRDKKGKFELANGGTIFLDEIGEMSLKLQSKLLRVIQEKTISPVGSEEEIKVDVRILAATNRELEKEVAQGTFREDLYYRLNVMRINLPSLRERKEDIYLLVGHFLNNFNKKHGTNYEDLTIEALEKLMEYDWPGNVRELENIIERACIMGSGKTLTDENIVISTLDKRRKEGVGGNILELDEILTWKEAKERFEKNYLQQVLTMANFNIQRAARILNIQRSALYQKIKKYGITKNK